jgi:hypothetical protein
MKLVFIYCLTVPLALVATETFHSGKTFRVSSVMKQGVKKTSVYNLAVKKNADYYVGSDDILVHNCGPQNPITVLETTLANEGDWVHLPKGTRYRPILNQIADQPVEYGIFIDDEAGVAYLRRGNANSVRPLEEGHRGFSHNHPGANGRFIPSLSDLKSMTPGRPHLIVTPEGIYPYKGPAPSDWAMKIRGGQVTRPPHPLSIYTGRTLPYERWEGMRSIIDDMEQMGSTTDWSLKKWLKNE